MTRSRLLASPDRIRRVRIEISAGLVTALALIPETISFSILAGVGPAVGLFTSFVFLLAISVTGGRPAMVSGAAGSTALVVAPLVASHGVDHLIAAVLLGGLIQVLLAGAGVAKLLRFIPKSAMTGFVNALAILIFAAQLPHLIGVPWLVYPMVAAGLLMMAVLPRLTTLVPAPVVATVVLTAITAAFAIAVPTVGDEGRFSSSLPSLGLPDVPVDGRTLLTILPYALALALVGLLETLITQELVDELTGTHTGKRRECGGQGVANVVVGLFGGMGGCAMIGQTMMNVKSCGARTRLSTLTGGLVLLVLVVFCEPVLTAVPMAALVAVMIVVAFTTMDWTSISWPEVRRRPMVETATMVVTVAVAVPTHNLAYGVAGGVLTAFLLSRVPAEPVRSAVARRRTGTGERGPSPAA